MKQNPSEDELLRRYLLEELPQEEADELDRRLLVDDELFELAEAVEADLLAAAARGELAPAERERVLKRLVSSPQGRERLALAWALNRVADEEPRKADVVQFPHHTRAWKPAVWTAMAASLVATVIGISIVSDDSVHEEAPVLTSDAPTIARPVQPKPPIKPPAALPVPKAPGPDQMARAEERPDTGAVKALGRTVLYLSFLAGHRGEVEAEALHEQLHLTPDIGTVELQLDVADYPDLKSFNVAVRNKEHDTIWQQSGLEPRPLDEEKSALVLEVPAAKLAAAGWYEVRLQGVSDSGETEDISPQEFEVVTNGNP